LAKWYLAPWLAEKTIHKALMLLIIPHTLRHVGLTFFVPGVVAETMPDYFANSVAFGDLISGLLAILCLIALKKGWRMALLLVWIFNIFGTVDLLNAMSDVNIPAKLGATWFIPTFWVPFLLVTHFMIFVRLFKRGRSSS